MKKEEQNQKGITLIALIITIVVLLILAGVSINAIVGENGILNQAQKASEKTKFAQEQELKDIAMAEATMHNEIWTYKTADGKTIPIPAGFAPTKVEGEDTIKEGVVITDNIGNEFVWIPCSLEEYKNAEWEDDWRQWQYKKDNVDIEWSDSQTEIGIKSLKKLEDEKENIDLSPEGIGFYVARYEAGIPNNVDFFANSEGDIYYLQEKKDTSDYNPISQKGVQAWNCVSRVKAKAMSEKMYANGLSINSYLIDSHAWNYICDKIIANYTEKSITENCASWGNYKNTPKNIYNNLEVLYAYHGEKFYGGDFLENKQSVYHFGKILDNVLPGNSNNYWLELSTGASEEFKAYNIYDMAGNLCEFTTEIGTSDSINGNLTRTVVRGGSFREDRYR